MAGRNGSVCLASGRVTRGVPAVPDAVLTEIVEDVFLPLVRGRGRADGTSAFQGPVQS